MEPVVIMLIVIGFLVLVSILGGIFFYNTGIRRSKKEFMADNPDLKAENPEQAWDFEAEWMEKQPFEEWSILSDDGLTLYGYYLEAEKPTHKAAIIAHGYTSRAKEMGGWARFYHEEMGFNVFMPDTRGHGKSEGDYIGFGWHDRKDYLKWMDYLMEKKGQDLEIILHGVSMGGATVSMISGEELPQNVKAIVSDCAYTSARDILSYQMKKMYKVPQYPLVPITSLICKLRAGYYFGEASALEQVKKAKVPILFIHGGKDEFVPTEMVHQLYDACSSEKDLLLVPEAGHGNAYFTDKAGYGEKVASFIKKYMKVSE